MADTQTDPEFERAAALYFNSDRTLGEAVTAGLGRVWRGEPLDTGTLEAMLTWTGEQARRPSNRDNPEYAVHASAIRRQLERR